MPFIVDHSQRGITVFHRIRNDADGEQIVNLIQRDLLALQLLEHRVGALEPASTRAGIPSRARLTSDSVLDLFEKCFVGGVRGFELFQQIRSTPPAPDIGTPGPPVRRGFCPCRGGARWARRSPWSPARCASCLSGDSEPRVRMLCRRSASFTRITRMSLTMASSILRTLSACRSSREARLSLLSLVTPSTHRRHFVAEILADLLDGGGGVLHHVMQQTGFKTHHVHVHVGQLAGDQQRMDHVGLARDALLALVTVRRRTGRPSQRASGLRWGATHDAGLQLRVEAVDFVGSRWRNRRGGTRRPGSNRACLTLV